jgi:hypothetical protein
MTANSYNSLEYNDRISLIYNFAVEIDTIFPWTGNMRIVKIYAIDDFIVELECDLTKKTSEFTSIEGHTSYEYLLDKYPHHFDKLKRDVIFNILT